MRGIRAAEGLQPIRRYDDGGNVIELHPLTDDQRHEIEARAVIAEHEAKARGYAAGEWEASRATVASPHQNSLRSPVASPRSSKLKRLTPADCAASEARGYVVKGLIAPRDLVLMVAKPGGGKSTLAPSICYAIAQGRPVFGRRTKPGTVHYVPAEDGHGMKQRVHALKRTHGDAPGFNLIEGVSDLLAAVSPDRDALLQIVRADTPALVVIDTIAAAFVGLEENTSQDMSRVIDFARKLTETGAAVLLLHHPAKGIGSDGTARGHGSLDGAADVSLLLEPPGDDGAIHVRMGKNRNGPAYDSGMGFTIKSVRIGTDEDDDAIFAPVAAEVEGMSVPSARTPKSHSVALGYLADQIAKSGQPLPGTDGFPPGLRGVAEELWRCECDTRRLSTAETDVNRTRVFRRVYGDLIFRKKIGARDGLVWMASPEARS